MSSGSATPDYETEDAMVVHANEPSLNNNNNNNNTGGQHLRQAFAQQCNAYDRKAELQSAESDQMKEVGNVHFLSSEKSKRSFGVR